MGKVVKLPKPKRDQVAESTKALKKAKRATKKREPRVPKCTFAPQRTLCSKFSLLLLGADK